MSLQGVLSDFGVADVFQLIAQQRKTGVLRVQQGDIALEVFFCEGEVVRARPEESKPDEALATFLLRAGGISEIDLAEARRHQDESMESLPTVLVEQGFVSKADVEQIARLLSEETIFELFLWDEGSFAFRPDGVQDEVGDLMRGAEMVLLDALRMRDEWPQVKAGLSDLSVVIEQNVALEEYREKRSAIETITNMSGEELDRLFMACDGRMNARRIIDLSRLGTFQGSRGLVVLLHETLLRSRKRRARVRPARPISAAGDGWQAWARVPWILIATGLVSAALWVGPAPAPRRHPLPRVALAEARAGAHLDRLRLALEAHRWRSGKYPESLTILLEDWNVFLAGVPLDRYSYRPGSGAYRLTEH